MVCMTRPENCPEVTVLVCTLNEESNLPYVLPRIPTWIDEILLVDGHSTDRTVETAKSLRPDIRVIYPSRKGKGCALRCGIQQAKGEIVVTLDADGSMNPEEICSFVDPLCDGYEMSKGSRFIRDGNRSGTDDMERHRILGNKAFVHLTNLLYGSNYTDLAYGYNAFKKGALQKVSLQADGFDIETEIMIKARKAGLKTIEVPSFEHRRRHGKTNLHTFRDGWRILKMIVKERLTGFKLNGRHAVEAFAVDG